MTENQQIVESLLQKAHSRLTGLVKTTENGVAEVYVAEDAAGKKCFVFAYKAEDRKTIVRLEIPTSGGPIIIEARNA